jgi:internalin A
LIGGHRRPDVLKNLKGLQDLSLTHTAITDAGLVHLKGLASQRRVHLEATKVTDIGVRDLQQARPDLIITH